MLAVFVRFWLATTPALPEPRRRRRAPRLASAMTPSSPRSVGDSPRGRNFGRRLRRMRENLRILGGEPDCIVGRPWRLWQKVQRLGYKLDRKSKEFCPNPRRYVAFFAQSPKIAENSLTASGTMRGRLTAEVQQEKGGEHVDETDFALLNSHIDGDEDQLLSIALQIAAQEARQGRPEEAEKLKRLVQKAREQRHSGKPAGGQTPIPLARPRGELQGLVESTYPRSRCQAWSFRTRLQSDSGAHRASATGARDPSRPRSNPCDPHATRRAARDG